MKRYEQFYFPDITNVISKSTARTCAAFNRVPTH